MKIKSLLFVLFFTILFNFNSNCQRKSYGGGHHTASHGGTYVGGAGGSHKGGHYRNSSSYNRYGRHK